MLEKGGNKKNALSRTFPLYYKQIAYNISKLEIYFKKDQN